MDIRWLSYHMRTFFLSSSLATIATAVVARNDQGR